MRKRPTLLLLSIGAIWLSGCGDSVEDLTSSVQPTTGPAGRVAFSQVQPTLLEKCAICHDEYNDSAKILRQARKVRDAVYGGYMPAPGVAPLAVQDRINLIAWLDQVRAEGLAK